MRIVQAVFGVFHHFELAHQLHRRHHLERVFSTWPWVRLQREGLPKELVSTFPLIHTAEYLLSQSRFTSPRLIAQLASWNTRAFDLWTHLRIPPCDAFIAISGAGLLTAQKVHANGGKFICDRGSTHQRFQEAVVAEEHRRWNLPPLLAKPHIADREDKLYAQADAITVPSTVAKRSFLANGIPEHKLHVIPYGVRLDRFTPSTPPPADSFEVLFAGNVSLRKGIPYLLEAFKSLRHPNKHLTIVGSIQPQMRELLHRLPTDNVSFTGPLSQPDLIERMRSSHVLVLPSVEEGLALVQAQAMACGCPVIATTASGAEDLFTNEIEGFIIPDRDPATLTSRMQQLADDPTLREKMSERSLRRVRQLGGWDTYGDRWDHLLHQLTGISPDTA